VLRIFEPDVRLLSGMSWRCLLLLSRLIAHLGCGPPHRQRYVTLVGRIRSFFIYVISRELFLRGGQQRFFEAHTFI
jgi:hypothetical protein